MSEGSGRERTSFTPGEGRGEQIRDGGPELSRDGFSETSMRDSRKNGLPRSSRPWAD